MGTTKDKNKLKICSYYIADLMPICYLG